MYRVIDRQTNKVMGIYKTLRSACRAVNRLDNIYGGYRYQKQLIEN